MKKMNKKGFTLVEIMIVVAIIGLLAAIGIPSILNAYSKSQDSAAARNIAEVNKAKAQLTLPVGVSGGIGADVTNALTATVNGSNLTTHLEWLLHISGPEALNIGTNVIDYGDTVGDSASYPTRP